MVNLSYHSGRNILRGFLDYAESRPDWQVSIRTPTGEDFAAFAADVRDGKVDGLVTSEMEDASFARIVEQASFPVVVIGTREDCIPARTRNVVFVTTDETLIAQTAAKHLLSVGSFASFGFVHAQLRHCHYLSTLRQAGFAAAIAAARRPCHSFPEGGLDDFLSFDEQALGAWLSGLPRPVGVCAAGDRGGTAVIRACRQAGLRVPEDVSVIGINDDALCCRSVRPSLSSVFTDNRGEGRCAAAELGRLICARRPHLGRPLVVRRPDCSVTVRDSTRILPSGLVLVERARRFIAERAARGVSARDVVAHLRVSRRLLDLRFREFSRRSLHEEILAVRIEAVKRALLADRRSIESVSRACGFASPNHLKALFRARVGMTMSRWRQSQGGR